MNKRFTSMGAFILKINTALYLLFLNVYFLKLSLSATFEGPLYVAGEVGFK